MRFRPRHYVLIVILLALAAFNLWRSHNLQHQATTSKPLAPGISPAWPLYDTAANLRDAPDDQFQPALKALGQAIDTSNAVSAPPQTSTGELADLHGCQTWLLFYRQEHLHPAINKPGWAQQLQSHVNSCVANHRDISA